MCKLAESKPGVVAECPHVRGVAGWLSHVKLSFFHITVLQARVLPVNFGDDNVRVQNCAGPLIESHGTTMGS